MIGLRGSFAIAVVAAGALVAGAAVFAATEVAAAGADRPPVAPLLLVQAKPQRTPPRTPQPVETLPGIAPGMKLPLGDAATFNLDSVPARISVAGSYLAARHATVERDASAAAAFYRSALAADPGNADLADRAFIASIAEGDIPAAVRLAERILVKDKANRVARLVTGVHALKQKQYAQARRDIAQSVRGPITDLVATLLSGWASFGAGDTRGALATIDKLQGPEWYPIFKDLHSAMIADLARKNSDAATRFARAYKLDDTALRTADAYGRFLSRTKSIDAAKEVYDKLDKASPRHPLVRAALTELANGKTLPPLIDSPQEGGAEALYGIASSLTRRGGEDLALVYLQLALYLAPDHPLALLSLADLYETVKKPQLAIPIYERFPASSPLKRTAQIQLAASLDQVQRSDDAIATLKSLIAERPGDLEAIMALGNVEREHKKFAQCAETYTGGINGLSDADKRAWVFYYLRGICFERSKQWTQAEADLKKALSLQPEQPLVLNYLGYSWIDQGVKLDEGMAMIRRAVAQRPDDGYIVDSLGWAYYRIGQYDEAVKNLERAVELKPDDPTINDHLGDAYWRVGRTLEARFQWQHAKDLKPEPEDLPKIEAKIRDGLAEDKASAAENDKAKDLPKEQPKNGG